MIDKNQILAEAKKIVSLLPLEVNNNYLASGNHSDVFKFEFSNESFVVKKFHSRVSLIKGISFVTHLPLYESVLGIKNVVQLITHSKQDDILVTSYIPGSSPTSIDVSRSIADPEKAIRLVIEILIEMHYKGVVLDPNPENFKVFEDELYIVDFSKKPNSYNLGYEILKYLIPSISINEDCLMELIPKFFRVLRNFKKLKVDMTKKSKSLENHIKRVTPVYNLKEIQGLNSDEQLMAKLIQLTFIEQKRDMEI